ncbi:hypothetical protein ASG39_06460 [Rhizobium sp. Leaf371]|uniref:hypothetical protein n=1 Tax=Rhizobium sp. Leaf371 TaxID=1736355 RepID=UPI0007132B3B|nr:hypothetical protein [Rhizobium sp. Leaf371]KQS67970.1 hypothetical protein ASG39_06460 [Rhizobium sp. Leaf371]
MDAYKNSSQTISSLKYLGIDTVRDSLAAYGEAKPVLDAMAAAGIKFDFLTSGGLVAGGANSLSAYVEVLQAFQAAHPGSIISVEGLNEANIPGAYIGAFTMEAAAAFQRALYTAVKGATGLSDVAVLNLSISHDSLEAYTALGDLGQYSDYANAHAYPNTGSVIDRSMQNSMDLAGAASRGDPIIITETGYTTYTPARGIGASETAQAKLILNNLLNAYDNGSQQTYIYTLFDTPSSAFRGPMEVQFGVFHADGSPKLAASAIHNFTTILTAGDDGSAAPGTTINYSLSNAPSETHAIAMLKSGGVYDLVVWTDKIVWNATTGEDIVTAATEVTVDLGKVEALVYVYDPLTGLEPIAVYRNVQSIKIPLSDHALIIEVGASGPVTEPVTTVAPNLTMTAAELVARIDTLAGATGLQSIALSDSAVLKVSSIETMKHMIATYGALLSKVQGDVTFSVSFEQQTWRKVQTFDEAGNLLTRTEYGLSSGTVVSENKIFADGGFEYTAFGIKGKSYVTETQVVNAGGKLIDLIRKHADGTLDFRQTVNADGSKVYLSYDAKGALVSDVTVGVNGSRLALTYDPATSKLTQSKIEYSDGTFDVKNFVNGVLANETIKHADGTIDYTSFNKTGLSYTTEHQIIGAAGNILLIERLHADGTFDYKEVRHLDGSKEISSYDAAGKISTHVTLASDGSRTVETFLKDGTGNVRTDAYDSAVKLLLADIRHQDGSHAITVAANEQTFHGGTGNDTIQFGNTIKGVFDFDGGNDTLSSFNVTPGTQDRILLDANWATAMSDLHLQQSGNDTVISFDNGHSITLLGISVGSVGAGNFLFV